MGTKARFKLSDLFVISEANFILNGHWLEFPGFHMSLLQPFEGI